jgi:hypothetical protein
VLHISPRLKDFVSLALVAQACNPSYLVGGDQEDHSSRPDQANSLRDPILKILSTKNG